MELQPDTIDIHDLVMQALKGPVVVKPRFCYERISLSRTGKPRLGASWSKVTKHHILSTLSPQEIRKIQTGGTVNTILARYRAAKVVQL